MLPTDIAGEYHRFRVLELIRFASRSDITQLASLKQLTELWLSSSKSRTKKKVKLQEAIYLTANIEDLPRFAVTLLSRPGFNVRKSRIAGLFRGGGDQQAIRFLEMAFIDRFELTRQPGRGILRAMDCVETGTAIAGPSGRRTNETFVMSDE